MQYEKVAVEREGAHDITPFADQNYGSSLLLSLFFPFSLFGCLGGKDGKAKIMWVYNLSYFVDYIIPLSEQLKQYVSKLLNSKSHVFVQTDHFKITLKGEKKHHERKEKQWSSCS